MRHLKKINHLGRKKGHREAMLSNMATSLITKKRITTTTAKAKALRKYVEPIITRAKDDSTHNRRIVFSYLQNKDAVSELFRDVAVKVANRPGGYTRIIKLGNRPGDNADIAMVELVDYNETMLSYKEESENKAGRRRRRGGKKKSGETQAPGAVAKGTETGTPIEEAETPGIEDKKAAPTEESIEETTAQEEIKEDKKQENSGTKAEEENLEDTGEDKEKGEN